MGKPNAPHWSKNYGSVIFKTRVTCTGTGRASVDVRVYGLMGYSPVANPRPAQVHPYNEYASDLVQTVRVNGDAVTFYTPKLGSNQHILPGGYYRGAASGKIVSPVGQNIATASTNWYPVN